MRIMKILDAIAFTTVAGAAIYLGLLGISGLDLVAMIFGEMSTISRLIFIAIGFAALYQLTQFRVVHKRWADTDFGFRKSESEKSRLE